METLKVPFLKDTGFNDPGNIFLNHTPTAINYEPWPTGGQKPEVVFFIAYGIDSIFLQFGVKEKYFKAGCHQTNDLVYKDSCVEFFIGFDEGETYYNFEFNAIGTAYAAYGSPGKRELLDIALINDITILAHNKTVMDSPLPFQWELTLSIPFTVFYKHSISTLSGVVCRGNFYKCGDELPEPHFICWNNIINDSPNFHLPWYFGKLLFESY